MMQQNITAHACPRDASSPYQHVPPSLLARRLATTLACGAVAALCLGAPQTALAQDADLRIKGITWDVIGLDSNKPETEGPNEFPVAARVKNCGNTAATDVVVSLDLKPGGNPFISIDGRDMITTATLAPGQVADFYFQVEIERTDDAFSEVPATNTKPYQIHVSWKTAGDMSGTTEMASTSPNRQLFVEKILSQNRNTADSITVDGDPAVFLEGQIRTFTLLSETATGYEQQETTINFPTEFFQILSVRADYEIGDDGTNFLARSRALCDPTVITNIGVPGEGPEPLAANPPFWTNNKVYADGCGWVNNYFDPDYHQSNEPCFGTSTRPLFNGEQELTTAESYAAGKVGGEMITTYKVLVVDTITTSVRLSFLVHDFSGSSYHYGFEEDIFVIEPTNILVAKTVFPETVEAGTTFTYTITVANNSPNPADDVVLTDTLPACISFESADPAPDNTASNPLQWTIGTLDPSESRLFEIVAEATCTIGACENTATVSTSDQETNYSDNIDTAAVTIVDTIAPVITCPTDATLECPVTCITPTCLGTASATDLCGVAMVTPSDSFETSCGATGILTRVWTATDTSGNSSVCTQTITIVDTTPPMITCPADATLECPADTTPGNTGTATATDACDPMVTVTFADSVTSDSCTTTITRTWTATDDCGNQSSCVQSIVETDTTPPMITCPPDALNLECPASTSPEVLGRATATDACDDSVAISFVDVTAGNDCITTIVRIWTATDDCGNQSGCSQDIVIRDTLPPAITCPADITLPSEPFPSTCTVAMYSATATDVCNNVMVTLDPPSGTCFPCGTENTVTATAVDTCGNTSMCTFSVTIEPCQQPPLGCTLTQGYWKNHRDDWPVDSLMLGNRTYSKSQALRILRQEVNGNGLVALSHQLIAAKLNVASGADSSCIASAILAADALIGNLVVPPIGNGFLPTSVTSTLNNLLDDYNNGRLCSPHCDDRESNPFSFKL